MRRRNKPGNSGKGGTLGSFAVDLIGALGGQANPRSRKLFESWQRWEGGWSNNAARFNPLNLTAPGSGFPTINSVGVVSMPSYQEGVRRTAELLKSGYPSLARAFQTGQVDFNDPTVQADLNRWLSGKRTPGMSPYVSKIARSYGANVPAGAGPPMPQGTQPSPISPLPQQAPQFQTVFDPAAFRSKIREGFLSGGGRMDLMQMPGMLRSSYAQVQVPQPQQFAQAAPAADLAPGSGHQHGKTLTANGKVMNLPWQFKSTHATSGLEDEGFTSAVDIMAHPGTSVRSPGDGVVEYFHPTGAQGGGSMLIRFANGKVGWLGHVDQGLPAGTKIKAGTQLALVSADHAAPHAHWSIK